MFVDRDFRPWLERFGPHREWASGFAGIDLEDNLTGGGWPKLEHFTLTRLQDVRQSVSAYFLVSQPSRWQGQHFTSERSLSRPATPISP